MKRFEERDRYEYPLGKDSHVMDVGAHKGAFASVISDKYKCHIHCFEPIESFYGHLVSRFAKNETVSVFNWGLGGSTRDEAFTVKGDMTGKWADQGEAEKVEIRGIGGIFPRHCNWCDLLKINIEGGEYELLEAILDLGLIRYFGNIQVQFHSIMQLNPIERRDSIRARLAQTHEEMYCENFIWEGWRLRT